MVVRDAMDQYVNTELADGAVARDAMDQYVTIMLSNGQYSYKFFFSGIIYIYLFFFPFIGHNFVHFPLPLTLSQNEHFSAIPLVSWVMLCYVCHCALSIVYESDGR